VDADSRLISGIPTASEVFDFEEVFAAQYDRIFRVIRRLVRDSGRAEDLAVEVCWKLWRKPPRKQADPGGWLYRTAIRAALDELRRQARREKYERIFSFPRMAPTPEQLHSLNERRERVQRVLASLKTRDAELLILRFDGFSYQEIEQMLAVRPGSVGVLLKRAQEAFRKEYVHRYGYEH
jgi:RNA polymerase sigma-70 factor (ECF subfamily)